jgi:hypothetical protein
MNEIAANNLSAFCAIWIPAILAKCGFHAVAQWGLPVSCVSGHTAAKSRRFARRMHGLDPRSSRGRGRVAAPRAHEKDRWVRNRARLDDREMNTANEH